MKQRMKNIVAHERRQVPQCNWVNYDLETADCIEKVMSNPDRFDELTDWLWCRIKRYQTTDMSSLPPYLFRLQGETAKEYLNRSFEMQRIAINEKR